MIKEEDKYNNNLGFTFDGPTWEKLLVIILFPGKHNEHICWKLDSAVRKGNISELGDRNKNI